MAGVPLSELLFGISFGAYWSGLYEHWQWTFDWSPRTEAAAAAVGEREPDGVPDDESAFL